MLLHTQYKNTARSKNHNFTVSIRFVITLSQCSSALFSWCVYELQWNHNKYAEFVTSLHQTHTESRTHSLSDNWKTCTVFTINWSIARKSQNVQCDHGHYVFVFSASTPLFGQSKGTRSAKSTATTIPEAGPALGMFKVFGRTGPQNVGGRNFGPKKFHIN